MFDPYLVQFVSTILSGIIVGVAVEIISKRLQKQSKRKGKRAPRPKPGASIAHSKMTFKQFVRSRQFRLMITSIAIVAGGVFGFFVIGRQLQSQAFTLPDPSQSSTPIAAITPTAGASNSTPMSSPTPGPAPTPTSIPTPIPKGKALTEINFSGTGVGNCDNYNANLLGYENGQYYIKPSYNGYIAVCNTGIRPSQGSLQVVVYPEKRSTVYGYGLLFGWSGTGLTTKEGCLFGIKQSETMSFAQSDFSEFNNGTYWKENNWLGNISLDTRPHTIRMTLKSDGHAIGYLDEKYVGEFDFTDCGKGPIGLAAWGDGDTKIYFDDLKLYDLP